MSTSDMICSYALSRNTFSLSELADYIRSREEISDSGLLWHLKKLIKQNKLSRLSRGLYGKLTKKEFIPTITNELKQLYDLICAEFPLINVAVYSGQDISSFQHHISANNALYVEVTKEATEAVFHFLIDKKKKAFHRPDINFMYDYVDLSEPCIIVKPLISESPLRKTEGVTMPTLEKMLVDLNTDPDFYYLQGSEVSYIIDYAISLFQLNIPKMLRYASRRGIKSKMLSFLKNAPDHD